MSAYYHENVCTHLTSCTQANEVELDQQSPTQVIRPHMRNIHRVEALETTAFLDIMGPPYGDDRPCTSYQSIPLKVALPDPTIIFIAVNNALQPDVDFYDGDFRL